MQGFEVIEILDAVNNLISVLNQNLNEEYEENVQLKSVASIQNQKSDKKEDTDGFCFYEKTDGFEGKKNSDNVDSENNPINNI